MTHTSRHARHRTAQRAIDPDHVDLALAWGRPIRQGAGRVAWHLGRREIDEARRAGEWIPDRALGVAVILAADGTLVTALRTADRHRLTCTGQRPRRRR